MSATNHETLAGIPLRYIALGTLTFQNSLLTILLHYSRTSPSATPYSPYAAVLLNEILKFFVSYAVALYKSYNADIRNPSILFEKRKPSSSLDIRASFVDFVQRSNVIRNEVFSNDGWKLSIPAILYVIQNNLQYVAASNLDVATFQVSYQLKILTTALCSVIILKQRLSPLKWTSLFLLACGVAIVQLQNIEGSSSSRSSGHSMNPVAGFSAVLAACFTSGLAGVSFEFVLKSKKKSDLWIRNMQLSLFSILPALIPTLFSGLSSVFSSSSSADSTTPWLFSGFGIWAWSTVLCQVFGGLVTALVIKYSGNILKGFATSLSILVSSLAGVFLFGNTFNLGFLIGCSTVLFATYMYNMPTSDTEPTTPVLPSPGVQTLLKKPSNLSEIAVTNLLTRRGSLSKKDLLTPSTASTLSSQSRPNTPIQSHHASGLHNPSMRRPVGEPITPPTLSTPTASPIVFENRENTE